MPIEFRHFRFPITEATSGHFASLFRNAWPRHFDFFGAPLFWPSRSEIQSQKIHPLNR